jgi:hypothetical protein
MSAPTTRRSLGIFWNGEECDGIMSEGVWACASRGGVRQPPPPLDGAFVYASPTQLAALQAELAHL